MSQARNQRAAKRAAAKAAAAPVSGVPEELRVAAAKLAKCKPEEVIGYREYDDCHVVVVHDATRVFKVTVDKKGG